MRERDATSQKEKLREMTARIANERERGGACVRENEREREGEQSLNQQK